MQKKNCCQFGKVWKISWKAEQKIRYNAWFFDIYFATLSKRAVIYIHSPINKNNNNNGHNDKNNDEQDDDDNDIEVIVHVTRIFFHFVLDKFIYKLTKHREKTPSILFWSLNKTEISNNNCGDIINCKMLLIPKKINKLY